MNEMELSKDINVITAEINNYMSELGKASFEIGKNKLGKNAKLKEIANVVSCELEFPKEIIIKAMLSVNGGVFNE